MAQFVRETLHVSEVIYVVVTIEAEWGTQILLSLLCHYWNTGTHTSDNVQVFRE